MEEKEELPHKYTEGELEDVAARLKETQEWLDEGVKEQKKLLKNDDPILISAEMKARGVTLQNHVKKLMNRRTPKAPPKPKKSEEPAPEATPANEGSSEDAGTKPAPHQEL
jgi:hypoxia up-regulated 1